MMFGFTPLQGGYDVPMRIVGANIPYEWLIYLIMWIPIGILLYGIYKRYQVWTLAKEKFIVTIRSEPAFYHGFYIHLHRLGLYVNLCLE